MENQPGISQEFVGMRKGDYEILSLLGTGGMGQVFKVRNVFSDRIEAMKVLLPNLADQKNLADRFLREIKVLAGLHHPNIAELRTALTINNQLVMIMEYVEGTTLAARIQQGAIPYGQALGYIDQVLSALSYAHKQHIIHRDIKPSNMMLTPEGTVKLMDFGIAQRGDQGELTKTNTTVGSFAYMSPEQIKGEPVDARSDLYSVGVSLYEMVTGQRPFPADTAFSAMQAHLQTVPTPPIDLRPDLPLPLSQLILLAVAKDPAARFQTADAFAAALQTVAPKVAGTVAAIPVPSTTGAPAAARTAAAASTGAAPAPVAATSSMPMPPPTAAASSQHSSHRGLYIALGAAIVLVVLAAAAIVPRHAKTAALKKQAAEQSARATVAPATTAVPAATVAPVSDASTAAAAPITAATESLTANPSAPPPANSVNANPPTPTAHAARAAKRAAAQASPTEVSAQTTTPAAPATPAPDAAQLQQLDLESDQLSGRVTSVSASLDNLQKQQAAQGLGLRGDIVASEQRMQTYMNKAQAAIQAQDAATAKKYLDLATAEVEKLEKFLGR
jgi:eukaryotic-like serine/threonine-protein kinase